ncbi:MAG: hypothetical protein A3J28_04060 [Acidobacteria bacterium RIFCSPLOWO2_12_FULL_60_22]|nr:MAG: hypothetical protein A3J28_04060 [Acidobacteria bacterium RIFCSPLOWO2_12_FULL_60_22]
MQMRPIEASCRNRVAKSSLIIPIFEIQEYEIVKFSPEVGSTGGRFCRTNRRAGRIGNGVRWFEQHWFEQQRKARLGHRAKYLRLYLMPKGTKSVTTPRLRQDSDKKELPNCLEPPKKSIRWRSVRISLRSISLGDHPIFSKENRCFYLTCRRIDPK